MFNQAATIHRAPELTGANGVVSIQRDWDNAAEIPIDWPVSVQPQGGPGTAASTEANAGTTTRWVLISPPGSGRLDIRQRDRIAVADIVDDSGTPLLLEVDGRVEHWPSPDGGWHHTEANLILQPLTRAGTAGGAASAARDGLAGATNSAWSPT